MLGRFAPSSRRQFLWRSVPVFVALLVLGGIYYTVSEQLDLGPRGLIPAVIVILISLLITTIMTGKVHISRSVALLMLGIVTLSEAVATSTLIADLLANPTRISDLPHNRALVFLRDAALIWFVNVVTFAYWYWEIDGGGPAKRHVAYDSKDFLFPQVSTASDDTPNWIPHFVDYLFLAFNTSTAFSPTDTQVLSIRAKLLMMVQSLISITMLVIVAARAINTL